MIAMNSKVDNERHADSESQGEEVLSFVRRQLTWLSQLAKKAEIEASKDSSFGLFGTSICATWLATILGEKVDFFVDEDISRQEKEFMGKPVISPQQVPLHSKVYLALVPTIAARVRERLNNLSERLIMPPSEISHGSRGCDSNVS